MIVIRYTLFAVISTIINLFVQSLIFEIFVGKYNIFFAIILGTFAGLITKYMLDKKWVFYYESPSISHNTKKFFLYSLMGVLTTVVFWVTELTFYYLSSEPSAKYIGAIIGLTIGYIIKFYLDKRYVFIK